MPALSAPTGLSSSLCKKTPMLRIDVVSGIIMNCHVSGWTCKDKGGERNGKVQALTVTGTLIPYNATQHQQPVQMLLYRSLQRNECTPVIISSACHGCRAEARAAREQPSRPSRTNQRIYLYATQ